LRKKEGKNGENLALSGKTQKGILKKRHVSKGKGKKRVRLNQTGGEKEKKEEKGWNERRIGIGT